MPTKRKERNELRRLRAAFLTVDRRQRRAAAAVEKAKGPTRRRLAADLVAVEADWLGTRAG